MKHVHTDDIDAADPGLGAPGTLPPGSPAESDAEQQAFDARMAQERENPPLFRTPVPDAGSPTQPGARA